VQSGRIDGGRSVGIVSLLTKGYGVCLLELTVVTVCKEQTPWHVFRKRNIRPRGRRLSVKLVPTIAGRGVSHGQNNGFLRPLISVF
jgi:hypothetical protein